MVLSEEAKPPMEVLSEAMNFLCSIYDADYQDLEEPHEGGAREAPMDGKNSQLCKSLYFVRRKSEMVNTNHDVLAPNDMDGFCDRPKKLINPGGLVQAFSALQFFSWW